MSARAKRPGPHYRVVAYELDERGERIVMDATGAGFLAVSGTITEGHMTGEVGSAGPRALQEHMALLIANEPTR